MMTAQRCNLRSTSRRLRDLGLQRATLLVDRRRAGANLARFATRARAGEVVLRPHFKTHQSAAVAEWFRQVGVTRAAVSSVGMAGYFADHGWTDLTLAIGANPLEMREYDELAGRIELGLTIDAPATLSALVSGLRQPVTIWIEIDTGHGRGGVRWDDSSALIDLVRCVVQAGAVTLGGLLTHGGHSYASDSQAAAATTFATVRRRLQASRATLREAGLPSGILSAGDTPGFAASEDWSGLDEARPGNFVFFDLMQLAAGVCTQADLACAVACPVIGVYPERHEALVHAGAVHLSLESLPSDRSHGRLLGIDGDGFATLLEGWSVGALSQEHGRLVALTDTARRELADLQPGDLVLIAPVHACLTCEQFDRYWTLDGQELPRYRRG